LELIDTSLIWAGIGGPDECDDLEDEEFEDIVTHSKPISIRKSDFGR